MSSAHDVLPSDFSSVFGAVAESEPSFDSTTTELPSFVPYLTDDSPLLAEATRLRRVELELKLVEERRRMVESELALERMRHERELRERQGRMGPPSSAPSHHVNNQGPYYRDALPIPVYAQPYTQAHPHPQGQPYAQQASYGREGELGSRSSEASSSRIPYGHPPPPPHQHQHHHHHRTYAPYPHQPTTISSTHSTPDGVSELSPPYRVPSVTDGEPGSFPSSLGHSQPTPSPVNVPRPQPHTTFHPALQQPPPVDPYYQGYASDQLGEPSVRPNMYETGLPTSEFGGGPVAPPPWVPAYPRQRDPSSATSSASSSSAPTPQHYNLNPTHPTYYPQSASENPSPTSVTPYPVTSTQTFFSPSTEQPTPAIGRESISSTSSSSNSKPSVSTTFPTPSSSSSVPGAKKKRILYPTQPIATCSTCSAPIARLYLRGDKDSFDVEWDGCWTCQACVDRTRVEEGKSGKGSAGGESGLGRRKRNRETQDVQAVLICDVCMRQRGRGGIVARDGKQEIGFTAEFVCISCDERYQRCTDCGGGGGGRIGIGKWRSKELFLRNRKTCSLAHTRIGGAPLELGVWEISELDAMGVTGEIVQLCEKMWSDRTLARMAVPDVLEVDGVDRDGHKVRREFADIRRTLDRGWPSRGHVTGAREPTEANVSRRYLGLTWVKTRSRRGTAAEVDADGPGEPEEVSTSPEQNFHEYKESGLPNVRKITGDYPDIRPLVIPSGSELVGLWVGDWNMRNGTLLISTSLPFEGSDGDDRSALTVGEIACRIVQEIDSLNTAASHLPSSYPRPPPIPPLEHLWVVSDGTSPAIRERMHDILHRKRQFLPLDEYLERHKDVRPEIFEDFRGPKPPPPHEDDGGKRTWADVGGGGAGEPAKVMVRWLGLHFDRQRLEELAGSEFGKKLKSKKKK